MKQMIWLSFDLGIRGDYEGMYSFLDNHEAMECGDNMAALQFEWSGGDMVKSLQKSLKESVKTEKRSRIYVVFKDGTKVKGKFVVGKRKSSPWKGYGNLVTADEEDVGE